MSAKRMSKLERAIIAWSKALKHASAEHGRPNSFGVTELAREYGLNPRDGYRLGTTRRFMLWQLMGGGANWGTCPTYSKGKFYV